MALAIHDERLTRRVGAAVLVVAGLLAVFVVVLMPRLELGGCDVRIHFGQATGVVEGAPVRVSGHVVGHVRSVTIAPGAKDGGIVVEIRVKHGWARRIPINSDFYVDAKAALAPRYISIGAPPHHADPGRPIHDGDEVTGIDPPSLDRILQQAWDQLGQLQAFLDALRPATKKLDASIARLSTTIRGLGTHPGVWDELDGRVAGAIDEARAVYGDLQAGHIDADHLRHLAASIDATSAHVGAAITDMRARIDQVRMALALVRAQGDRVVPQISADLDHTLATADQALATAQTLVTQLQDVARRAVDGPGSIAAFGADLELSDEVKDMTKLMKRSPWLVAAPPSK